MICNLILDKMELIWGGKLSVDIECMIASNSNEKVRLAGTLGGQVQHSMIWNINEAHVTNVAKLL